MDTDTGNIWDACGFFDSDGIEMEWTQRETKEFLDEAFATLEARGQEFLIRHPDSANLWASRHNGLPSSHPSGFSKPDSPAPVTLMVLEKVGHDLYGLVAIGAERVVAAEDLRQVAAYDCWYDRHGYGYAMIRREETNLPPP